MTQNDREQAMGKLKDADFLPERMIVSQEEGKAAGATVVLS